MKGHLFFKKIHGWPYSTFRGSFKQIRRWTMDRRSRKSFPQVFFYFYLLSAFRISTLFLFVSFLFERWLALVFFASAKFSRTTGQRTVFMQRVPLPFHSSLQRCSVETQLTLSSNGRTRSDEALVPPGYRRPRRPPQ